MARGNAAAAGGNLMDNNPNDERLAIHDADVVPTPMASQARQQQMAANTIQNAPHDEAIEVDDDHRVATPAQGNRSQRVTDYANQQYQQMQHDDDEEEEEEDEEDEDDIQRAVGYAGQKPEDLQEGAGGNMTGEAMPSGLDFNPNKYAKVNAKASREMQDLFRRIIDYEPFVAELPAKLYPFIPDYFPAIGELDPFINIPRPDGRPDGLGLYMVDEPGIPQSNPAVVQLELRATNAHSAAMMQVVDSFEDAANRPEVIDRWISDIKKVHYKKALPTVTYQKPMPEIETLLQIWPQEFEDMLNSDVQFPPPNIDLDIEQYIRTLCAVIDIPTYNSLIDSLHVMFTVFEDFRTNQHFQHE
ncbi:hypothetical protein AGDE_12250 [Angomonas deanei]|uniref:Intraflagellar transport complex B protein 46 C terminal, putative n=1 Tax=Angomonas deanei TaxID=59799 RepID=A0A7G2CGW7_9TRYP|nr:hypothetical protein AGDE_12250 [Angomonas deanei]CAD2218124.1 Intraflagellar transport complex B protein 46 C terminal, putative [Angomonas deanei]|eukprot:EPY24631.1 hypothetical protein AGDE_12250 [Angomonas deanei]